MNASDSVSWPPKRWVLRQQAKPDGFTALKVEGTLEHPQNGADWEYSVVLSIRNERGEEVARQVVGVGALRPTESRTFTLSVVVVTPGGRGR